MKRMTLALAILVAAAMVFQGAVYAQPLSGKVVSVDTAANSLTISQADPTTGAEQNAVVWVKAETAFSGIDSLASLQAGDEVSVEVEQDQATGNWIALSIQRQEAPAAEAPAAAPAQ